MPQVVEVLTYAFAELSAEAKETARQWMREANTDDTFWSESVLEDFERACGLLGVTIDRAGGGKRAAIYWSGFSSQGDGASFAAEYAYKKGAEAAIAAEYGAEDGATLKALAVRLVQAQKPYFYSLTASVSQSGRYSHEMTMSANVESSRFEDVKSDTEEEVLDIMRDLARWLYKSLETEYDYTNSDECIDETIEANEYRFTEEGAIF